MAVSSVVKVSQMSPDLRWDAEHYRPEYLSQDSAIARFKKVPLGDAADIRDGNHLSIAEEFVEDGVRYLRGQDLSDFFISDADPIYIPEKHYAALARSHMFPGDVLVSIVGTIGAIGFVTNRHGLLTGSCKLAIVRAKAFAPEYIAAYLASRIGQNEITRRIRGAVQMGLILPDLRELPIIEPSPAVVDRVVSLVRSAESERKRAAATFESATSSLVEELGLRDWDLATRTHRITNFGSLASRFDAEHFCMPGLSGWNPPFAMTTLADPDIATLVSNGVTPAAADYSDIGVPIIKVGDVDSYGLAQWGHECVRPDSIWGDRGELYTNDVVVLCAAHHIRYIGKAGLFVGIKGYNGVVRSVGELITVRPGSKINPQTLCLYLNLRPVRNEAQRQVRGLSAHLYPDDFRQIPVPLIPDELQQRLAVLFDESLSRRWEALSLLNEAKATIERWVWGGRETKGK